jgi:hypothetical protein
MIELARRFIIVAMSLGVIAGNSDEFKRLFEDAASMGRQIASAGDLRTIGQMLDYEYMKKGRYPSEKAFPEWMTSSLRESTGRNIHKDHWGNLLVYETGAGGKSFRLTSTGKDGIKGTPDDISYRGP